MVVFAPVFALYAALQLLLMATLVNEPVILPVAQIMRIVSPAQLLAIAGKIEISVPTDSNVASFVSLFAYWVSSTVFSSGSYCYEFFGHGFVGLAHVMNMFGVHHMSSIASVDMIKAMGILVIGHMFKTYYLGLGNLIISSSPPLLKEVGDVLCTNCLERSRHVNSDGTRSTSLSAVFVDAYNTFGVIDPIKRGLSAVTTSLATSLGSVPILTNKSVPVPAASESGSFRFFNAPRLGFISLEEFGQFTGIPAVPSVASALFSGTSFNGHSILLESDLMSMKSSLRLGEGSRLDFSLFGIPTGQSQILSPSSRSLIIDSESSLSQYFGSSANTSPIFDGLDFAAFGTPLFDMCMHSSQAVVVYPEVRAYASLSSVLLHMTRAKTQETQNGQTASSSGIFNADVWKNAIGPHFDASVSQARSFSSSGFYCYDSYTSATSGLGGDLDVSASPFAYRSSSQRIPLVCLNPDNSASIEEIPIADEQQEGLSELSEEGSDVVSADIVGKYTGDIRSDNIPGLLSMGPGTSSGALPTNLSLPPSVDLGSRQLGLVKSSIPRLAIAGTSSQGSHSSVSQASSATQATMPAPKYGLGLNIFGNGRTSFPDTVAPTHPSARMNEGRALSDFLHNLEPVAESVDSAPEQVMHNHATASSSETETNSEAVAQIGTFALDPFKLPSFHLGKGLALMPIQQAEPSTKLFNKTSIRRTDSDNLRRSAIMRSMLPRPSDGPAGFKVKRKAPPAAPSPDSPSVPPSSSDVFADIEEAQPEQLQKAQLAFERRILQTSGNTSSPSTFISRIPISPTPVINGYRKQPVTRRRFSMAKILGKEKENIYH